MSSRWKMLEKTRTAFTVFLLSTHTHTLMRERRLSGSVLLTRACWLWYRVSRTPLILKHLQQRKSPRLLWRRAACPNFWFCGVKSMSLVFENMWITAAFLSWSGQTAEASSQPSVWDTKTLWNQHGASSQCLKSQGTAFSYFKSVKKRHSTRRKSSWFYSQRIDLMV